MIHIGVTPIPMHGARAILELARLKIALFVTLSATVGFILANNRISMEMGTVVFGVLFLAVGASALNQYQERSADRRMERTRWRPIPSRRLSPWFALKVALLFLCLGSLILSRSSNPLVLGLGLLAILWYNGLYTFLKRRTAFAAIPGAMVGAIPPLLGWAHGGGELSSPQILATALFFFMWQIPHFWLFLLSSGEDYEKAGFPSLTKIFAPAQLGRMTFIWLFATAAASSMIPLFGLATSWIARIGLLMAGLWLVGRCHWLLKLPHRSSLLFLGFKRTNLYGLFVTILLALDHLL